MSSAADPPLLFDFGSLFTTITSGSQERDGMKSHLFGVKTCKSIFFPFILWKGKKVCFKRSLVQ